MRKSELTLELVEGVHDIRLNGLPDRNGARKKQLPSDRTVNQYLETARAFLNWCIEHLFQQPRPRVSRPKFA